MGKKIEKILFYIYRIRSGFLGFLVKVGLTVVEGKEDLGGGRQGWEDSTSGGSSERGRERGLDFGEEREWVVTPH